MIFTVLQPSYFPSFQEMAKALSTDVVVWADSFSFHKGSQINRTQIKTADGGKWLTIPVLKKGKGGQQIRDVEIDNHELWWQTHWMNILNNYKNSPYYFYFEDDLLALFEKEWVHLDDILRESFLFLKRRIAAPFRVVKSSELPAVEDRSERVKVWADACGCDSYLLEQTQLSFVDADFLKGRGVDLKTVDFQPVEYHQQFKGFVHNLSVLDLLFNEGEMSRNFIKQSFVGHTK